jgi:hypothetical protein
MLMINPTASSSLQRAIKSDGATGLSSSTLVSNQRAEEVASDGGADLQRDAGADGPSTRDSQEDIGCRLGWTM